MTADRTSIGQAWVRLGKPRSDRLRPSSIGSAGVRLSRSRLFRKIRNIEGFVKIRFSQQLLGKIRQLAFPKAYLAANLT